MVTTIWLFSIQYLTDRNSKYIFYLTIMICNSSRKGTITEQNANLILDNKVSRYLLNNTTYSKRVTKIVQIPYKNFLINILKK